MADDKDAAAEKQTFFGGQKDLNLWEQYEESLRDSLYHSSPHAVPLLVGSVLATTVWIVGYLWAFVAYDKHKVDGCSKPLLAWLVVEGITGLINAIFAFAAAGVAYNVITSHTSEKLRELHKLPRNFVGIITTYFAWTLWHFAWFIAGTAWIFQLGRHDPPCHKPLYDFVWWFLTIGWAWYILMALVAWVMSMCLSPPKREMAVMKRGGASRPSSDGSDRPNSAAAAPSSSSSPAVPPM